MRPIKFKLLTIVSSIIICLIISGCGDTQSEQKQTSDIIKEALMEFSDSGDIKKVERILRSAPRSSDSQALNIINATLDKAKADQMQEQIAASQIQINEGINHIKNTVLQLNDLILKKEKVESAMSSRQKSMNIMQYGNNDAPGLAGLKEQLNQTQQQIQAIDQQINELSDKAEQAKQNAQQLQNQANQILEKARLETDVIDKADLEQKALEILAGKNGQTSKAQYMSQYQDRIDQIEILNSQSEILEKSASNLEDEISKLQKRINDYRSADSQLGLSSEIPKLNSQINNLRSSVKSSLSTLDEMISKADKSSNDALDMLDNSISKFKRARDNTDIRQISQLFQADIIAEKAGLQSDIAKMYLSVSKDMDNIAKIVESNLSSTVNSIKSRYSSKAGSIFNTAVDQFNAADEEFQKVRFNPSCPVIKQRIGTLVRKASLAKKFENSDVYINASDSAKKLVEEVYQCDENFSQTYLDSKVKEL